jgi:vacuolar-type H+-ATPase subunit H
MAEQAKINDHARIALERIKDSESEARKIIQRAREEVATKIIPQAHQKARKTGHKSLEEARLRAEENKARMLKDSRKEAENILLGAEKEIQELRNQTEKIMPAAINRAAEKIKDILKKGLQ